VQNLGAGRLDREVARLGEHYHDDRGQAMWDTVSKLLAKRERESA
jgi:hypothetical protein